MQWVNPQQQFHSQEWTDACRWTTDQPWVDYSWIERRPANTTRVVFVRHGRSTYNEQQRFQGRSDRSVLTKLGWDTARLTGQALRGIEFDAVYTSPLQRAKQTARAMVNEMGCELRIADCSHLLEVNLPHWEGLTYASVKTEQSDLYRLWKQSPQRFSLPVRGTVLERRRTTPGHCKQFPVRDLYRQALDFWNQARSHHHGNLILAIAHGGSIRAAISTAIGLPPGHYHQLQQSNCGLSIVDVSWPKESLTGWLQGVNQTGHLVEALPKLKNGKTGLRVIAIPSHSDRADELHQWLKYLPIQHCWTDIHPSSRALAKRICTKLSPVPCNSLDDWSTNVSQAILLQGVATAAIVATPTNLAALLGAGLKLESRLALGAAGFAPNTATILHFPNRRHPPILQSLSFIPPNQSGVTR